MKVKHVVRHLFIGMAFVTLSVRSGYFRDKIVPAATSSNQFTHPSYYVEQQQLQPPINLEQDVKRTFEEQRVAGDEEQIKNLRECLSFDNLSQKIVQKKSILSHFFPEEQEEMLVAYLEQWAHKILLRESATFPNSQQKKQGTVRDRGLNTDVLQGLKQKTGSQLPLLRQMKILADEGKEETPAFAEREAHYYKELLASIPDEAQRRTTEQMIEESLTFNKSCLAVEALWANGDYEGKDRDPLKLKALMPRLIKKKALEVIFLISSTRLYDEMTQFLKTGIRFIEQGNRENFKECYENFLKSYADDKKKSGNEITLFKASAAYRNLEGLEILVEAESDFFKNYLLSDTSLLADLVYYKPVFCTKKFSEQLEMVLYLIPFYGNNPAKLDETYCRDGSTLLYHAVMQWRSLKLVQKLLATGVDITKKCSGNCRILHFGIYAKDEILKELLVESTMRCPELISDLKPVFLGGHSYLPAQHIASNYKKLVLLFLFGALGKSGGVKDFYKNKGRVFTVQGHEEAGIDTRELIETGLEFIRSFTSKEMSSLCNVLYKNREHRQGLSVEHRSLWREIINKAKNIDFDLQASLDVLNLPNELTGLVIEWSDYAFLRQFVTQAQKEQTQHNVFQHVIFSSDFASTSLLPPSSSSSKALPSGER